VQLNDRQLGGWTAYLTNNFIPDFQKFLNKPNTDKRQFDDLVSKFKNSDQLLTPDKFK
jgi:hypothetical protein